MMPTPIERFEMRYEPITESGCWIWLGSLNADGYGKFWANGKDWLAHRFSFEHFRGQIPNNVQLDHLCRMRCCVNPWHEELVTSHENTLRGNSLTAINSRKTACVRGHIFSTSNTYVRKTGRGCCECKRITQQKYLSKLKSFDKRKT